ncbi:hypothetical protein TCE0_011f00671 [Talaromyces pinophilus]|uniref:Nucleotide-diphospho-sugar transferase domain-containing protein n=1 Tax=Talaromyces pinophilus TaxID=128442 RepID=A0A0B8MY21_TALPI|nr:hypothetical protein TCE0_011f00671 [Talaromyces pinophilus]
MSRKAESFDFMFPTPERRRRLPANCRWPLSIALVAVTLIVIFFAYHNPSLSDSNILSGSSLEEIKPSSDSRHGDLNRLVAQLYKPFLHPIDAEVFIGENEVEYKIAQNPPRFTKSLGRKILLLDVDTRALNGEGGMMNEHIDYHALSPHTAGMLSHYLYAMVHGYDYKFIQAPSYTDRHQTWVKVPMIREALKTYDYVVFMDADAIFHYHHLPLEWLFNHWNITEETMLAMALDPDADFNRDEHGNVNLNTGFIIAQAGERTTQMFNVWEDCVTDEKYANCSKWRYEWSHEQAAFSNYLRYEYTRPNEVISLPCAEANGYPSKAELGCTGEFVRHYWLDKGATVGALQDAITQYAALRLHDQFHRQMEHTLVNATGTTLPLKDGETVVV